MADIGLDWLHYVSRSDTQTDQRQSGTLIENMIKEKGFNWKELIKADNLKGQCSKA